MQTAWNGEVIYPIEVAEDAAEKSKEAAAEDEEPQYKGADVFQRIAAMSRGIPEVALALWRKCLCEGEAEASENESLSDRWIADVDSGASAPEPRSCRRFPRRLDP